MPRTASKKKNSSVPDTDSAVPQQISAASTRSTEPRFSMARRWASFGVS